MCDTAVAVGSATASGHVTFAKNSDRHPNECQPLFHAPRQTHDAGVALRCQYVEIPQTATTWEVVGGRPWWLWGFETEARVVLRRFVDQTLAELDATVAAADPRLDEAARAAEPPIVLQLAHRAALNQAPGIADLEPTAGAAVSAT